MCISWEGTRRGVLIIIYPTLKAGPDDIDIDYTARYNNRPGSPEANSTISAVESQLTNMFQRDFLALLGMFK